ncbi:MAG: alanine racemase [Treponema sp.]|nr:alanine racemase [Treponema sp.]
MRATRAILHIDNFRENILAARKRAGPHPKICVPVKADAYGHGAVAMSRYALEAGAEYLAVADACEGAELRSAGIAAPVLLFSQALPEELPDIVLKELIPMVSDGEFVEEAARAAELAKKRLVVHLKVDTGMGRLGCRPQDAPELAAKILGYKWLSLGGVATHLSVSDSLEPGDIAYTKGQLHQFREAVDSIRKAGIEPGIVHAANSGALALHEDSFFDMVRPGIFLYGYSPNQERLPAQPVMELRSAVAFIKKARKGEAISYGRTWIAPEDTFIATIPAGYADGIPRPLSNNFSIRIRGRAYPVAGRICMDQCMVNLGPATEVERWDEATIFGPGFTTAAGIAEQLNTIPYDILCRISKRVPRVYVGQGI